ncbi:MAG: ThiF family adenylyltransferase, partial [Planctomycetaceae bacterium]|nr:ThiF family adenylyltransferase [Planctomycetaceae bacterium]
MTESSLQFNAKGRYHALEISEHWDLNWIRSLRALVVGAGALGNEVTKNLAMMGVKEIVIVDHDRVEVSNLTRSVFFREEDKGRAKVDVLAQRLRDLNPDVHVQPLLGKYSEVVGLGRLRHMDLIFSCLDNRTARSELNEACQKVGMAWVNGGMENLLGEVSVYLPDEGPCYECLMTADVRKAMNQARSCQKVALDAIAAGRAPTT